MKSDMSDSMKSNSVYFNGRIPWVDARYVVLIGNLGLVLIAVTFFYLQRTWTQIGLTLITALAAEAVLFSLTRKYESQKFSGRIPSALAEAGSCLILCRSKVLWMHPMLAALAVFSKYLIRKNEKDHIFNPANFAIIFALCFVPAEFYEFRVDDFSASPYPLVHVVAIGLVATGLANVWRVTLGYFAAAWLSALTLFPHQDYFDLVHALGPELGASSLIFAWLMITDPRSAPRHIGLQWLFGAVIGLSHIVLRYHEVSYSRFIALFFVTAAFYFLGLLKFPMLVVPTKEATT